VTQDQDSTNQVGIPKYFLQTCMKLLRDQKAIEGLQELIDPCAPKETLRSEMRTVNNLHRHKRSRREMRLSVRIGVYEMDQVILDLGFDANVLMKQTWELMGKQKLQWSPIQLRMENQQNIFPLVRLPGITVDIEGVHTISDFELIEIVDNSNPYPALLGIDWPFGNMTIINMKRRQMIFEGNNMRVIVLLDPLE